LNLAQRLHNLPASALAHPLAHPLANLTGFKSVNAEQQKQFLRSTAWLRPYTRWAAVFSIKTAGFLPAALRNLPLKWIKRILAGYQKRMKSGCKVS
jgi:hypothetical protein